MVEKAEEKKIEEPPKEIEKKKSERPKPRRFVSEVKSERKWTWQKKLEEHGYDKLGAHDQLMVDNGKFEEEDEKE